MSKKVFIIDFDLLSPISYGKDQLKENLQSNKQGEGIVRGFDTSGIDFKLGAEIREDVKSLYKDEDENIQKIAMTDRKFELTVALTHYVKNSFLDIIDQVAPEKRGVIMGIGANVSNFEVLEEDIKASGNDKLDFFNNLNVEIGIRSQYLGFLNPYDIHSIFIAEHLDCRAFQKSALTACTSSTQSIALGYEDIKNGKADIIIAGGSDSIINPLALIAFGKLGVIPPFGLVEKNTCKPFDLNRQGTLAGEASGMVILASEEFIDKSGIEPMAEVLGCGNTLDAYKITAPDPSGLSSRKAMRQAIIHSGIDIHDLDYVNAHGTGTRQNDGVELEAISSVLGDYAKEIPISSTKDRHGHAIAAAGVQELSVLLTGMKHNLIPANLNMKNPIDPSFNLPTHNLKRKINYALTNNFAFGGVNTSLIIKNLISHN